MKYLFPETLKAQTIFILCGIFILSHSISLIIYESNREKTILLTEATDLAARIVGIVSLANSFPSDDRQQILEAAETQFLATFPELGLIESVSCQHNAFSARMSQNLNRSFKLFPETSAEVCLREFNSTRFIPIVNSQHGFDVLVTVYFPDGGKTVFHAILPEGESLLQDAVLLYLFVSCFSALIFAGYLIRKVIVPLDQLAKAADEVGMSFDAPPLSEKGPKEVVSAARAFNQMQHRLKRMVHGQTDMLAAISHDLRSAITRLQLRTELLSDENEKKGLQRVLDDMRAMVQSVLDFIRGIAPSEKIKKIDLVTLVESLCEDLRQEGYPLEYRMDASSLLLHCRPVAFRRALQNIIDNAVKYGKSAFVTITKDNHHLIISVKDEGPGIPEEHLDDVLKPFFRLDKARNYSGGGTGLGLSITQNILQAHDGFIKFVNCSPGLRVEIYLPLKVV